MKKGREIQGLPIVALSPARVVGEVKELVIDPDRRSVAALLLAEATPVAPARVLPFESIRRVGPDAVTIENESQVVAASEHPRWQNLGTSRGKVVGLRVLTEEGRSLGTVSDVVVEERSGAIEQYELSAGILQDALGGRTYLEVTTPRSMGRDLMIVPETAVSSRQVREEGPAPSLEPPPWFRTEVTNQEVEMAAAELVGRQAELVVGRRCLQTIANEDAGGFIAFEGEPISQDTVEKAKAAGKLNELVEAAGEGALVALSRSLAERYALVAAGRMAGRTVHDTGGQVIVSQGDVITWASVERAREAGVLDQLMEAVQASARTSRWGGGQEVARLLWDQVTGTIGRLAGRR